VLDVTRTAFFSVALLGSSFTLWKAEAFLKSGKFAQFRLWLALTITLGAIFIGGQAIEYYGLISSDVTISDNLFTATFFTVTGFHGLHVIVGLIALTIAYVLAVKHDRNVLHGSTLKAIGIYWHFVDVVWIAVFCIIYLGFMQ
jgi:heme/copper-type cytochrome/quinol oxidase subunit 3